MTDYHCWQCGAKLTDLILPVSRREECRNCRAEIHACRMCVNWAPHVSEQCREDRAEPPNDKTAANFCDYFSPNPDAYRESSGDQDARARSELDALFSGDDDNPDDTTSKKDNPLDDLFDL